MDGLPTALLSRVRVQVWLGSGLPLIRPTSAHFSLSPHEADVVIDLIAQRTRYELGLVYWKD